MTEQDVINLMLFIVFVVALAVAARHLLEKRRLSLRTKAWAEREGKPPPAKINRRAAQRRAVLATSHRAPSQKKKFASLRDYDFPYGEGGIGEPDGGEGSMDSEADPNPNRDSEQLPPRTEWVAEDSFAADVDMVRYEYDALLDMETPHIGTIILRPAIGVDGPTLTASKEITIARPRRGTFGMTPRDRLVATQGYCSGGFYLDPEFLEQL